MIPSSTYRAGARRATVSPWYWLVALGWLSLLSACGGSADATGGESQASTLTSIVVSSSADSVTVGKTQPLTARALDQNGAAMTGVVFTWSSSSGSVASVSDGVVKAMSAGAVDIVASSGGVISNAAHLTVVAAAAKGSVTIDKASVFFSAAGQSTQLAGQVLDAQGAVAPGSITWTSTAPDRVSVDSNGRLVATAVGSAQIVAESGGLRSTPTLVIVAVPQAGALLVPDAQVVSVSAPASAASGVSGVGHQYEVTLQGVVVPAPGTVVLAAETAPIAGTVVATRQDATGLVVTLAIAPLYQLFSAYDIGFDIDLSGFAIEAIPDQAALAAAPGKVWVRDQQNRPRALAQARPLDVLDPFKAWHCDASIKPQLVGEPPLQLTLENGLHLVLDDRPGYSKHALEGQLAIHAKAGIKLKAGFTAGGRCDAQGQVQVKAFGWFSVLVMPAVRVGLGAEIKGEILAVQGELGVDGTVGVSGAMGWECGGASPDCRGLDNLTPVKDLVTKSTFPSANDMQVNVSGQFYVIAGLDASILLGALNAGIVEARIGPKQSFYLARENDQAMRADFASTYDLKLEGVVEPGPALKEAIEKVINSSVTGVKFEATFQKDISESPKGSLSVSQTRVALGNAVDFTVALAPASSLQYFLLGYNVTGVELWRMRDDEVEFKLWKAMTQTSSDHFTYHWKTESSDVGNYQFAAFVNTQIPTPLLEVAPNSIQSVEVSCFSAAAQAGKASALRALPGQAAICADTWVGTTTSGDAAYGPNQTEARLTLKVDDRVTGLGPGQVFYYAEGTVKVNGRVTDLNGIHCEYLPFEITIDRNTGSDTPGHGAESNQFVVNYGVDPPTAGGSGIVTGTQTVVCPGYTSTITLGFPFMSGPEVLLSADRLSWSGANLPFYSFQFTRP
ncbi:MAG: hypothetical protein ABI702_02300 [Burkholderiales bacterium]